MISRRWYAACQDDVLLKFHHDGGRMSPFEAIKHEEDGVEYWSARELLVMLGYASWQKFKAVIQDAMKACENSGQVAPDHFNARIK
jgi:hypothetical protein